MKTRIKVTTRTESDGIKTTLYQGQVKRGFVWRPALNFISELAVNVSGMCGAARGELVFAQKVIDILLEEQAAAERWAAVERTKKVTYIDYP